MTTPKTFDPILTQDALDEHIQRRLERATRRTSEVENDRDTWRREARKWEARAKKSFTRVQTLEKTITHVLDRLEDILEEEA